ncbi:MULTISPECIES: IS481 family transposase [unclassified Gordonia (in: high G+C Gram-positive bacteria)]|uniref:IS481 family transposase n=1 Tax=unclassified Gordonia (in: high G+C Gram-positive bacteria) TaxID=2657482 RepID=UPI001963846E|nr:MULTISPECIES: IS481 family transposase [unclassified Gordonia (in: high G+C Gram-positive bacteria)]MBN0975094.1 IS481 family transposase [Gordonia sp. BP-119]MBN0985267.1 IS481 family transposase [Gordonia sp. BP-94]
MRSHKNAPLTPEGRARLVERCRSRPIAHVAAEMGISRATASKWVNRHRQFGEIGLLDRSSAPARQPTAMPGETVARIESMRRETKWSASRIAFELHATGVAVSRRTITRYLAQLGLNRRRFIDPNGETNREVKTITAKHPGHMVHLDVKKVGRIPNGGGWRVHGKDSPAARAAARAKTRGARAGYTYLHSAIDGHTRLAYTESLENEQATTAVAFLNRARDWFAQHGIVKIERIITDNGACYRSAAFAGALNNAEHRRTKPYSPKHNGKVERYNRILAEEFLYARTWTSEEQRAQALETWNVHYNYHRPHGVHEGKPPASATPSRVSNVLASYS